MDHIFANESMHENKKIHVLYLIETSDCVCVSQNTESAYSFKEICVMPNQWTLYFNIWNDSLQQKSEAKNADVQIGSDDMLYVSIRGLKLMSKLAVMALGQNFSLTFLV